MTPIIDKSCDSTFLRKLKSRDNLIARINMEKEPCRIENRQIFINLIYLGIMCSGLYILTVMMIENSV